MKSSTENSYYQTANRTIDYISSHLHQPLDLDVIARQANVSRRQLLRIMRIHLNEPLAAYLTRQRMERAVMYMQTTKTNLATLAEKVGYSNPQSFTKAFKKQFGISPKAYLDKLQLRLEKAVSSSNPSTLCAQVVEEEELELVYLRILGTYGAAEPYEMGWSKLVGFLKDNDALSEHTRFIGISFDDPNVTQQSQLRFYACASAQKKVAPTGEFGTIQLGKGRYAMYMLRGSYAKLQGLYNSISVGFRHSLRHGVAFEEYLNSPHNTKEEDLLTKIFIPIE